MPVSSALDVLCAQLLTLLLGLCQQLCVQRRLVAAAEKTLQHDEQRRQNQRAYHRVHQRRPSLLNERVPDDHLRNPADDVNRKRDLQGGALPERGVQMLSVLEQRKVKQRACEADWRLQIDVDRGADEPKERGASERCVARQVQPGESDVSRSVASSAKPAPRGGGAPNGAFEWPCGTQRERC